MRRVAPVVVMVILAVARPAWAQNPPSTPLTLDAALAQALTGNRTIAAARMSRAVDAAGIDIARERPNPDFTFETTRETPRQSFAAALPIERGGKRDQRIAVASAAAKTGEADIDRVIAEVQNDVRRAYFQAVAADQRVTMAEELRTLATRAHDTAQARLVAGDVAQLEALQAELELASADNEVTGAMGDRVAARAELNTLLGRAPDAPLTLVDDFTGGALPTLAVLTAHATADNTSLHVIDAQLAGASAERALARAMQVSDVTVGAAATVNAAPDFNVGWRGSFTVTLPLFTKHQAAVTAADAQIARLHAERDALVGDITGAVAAALARATSARAQLDRYQTDLLPKAHVVEQMEDDAYRSGQTGVVALLQALTESRTMRLQAVQAGLDYQIALADLERAIGTTIIK